MINKKNIWFLTLFSLILALSVYYVTMPSELLLDVYGKYEVDTPEEAVKVEETDIIAVYKLEDETKIEDELDVLKLILLDNQASVDEKNKAYEQIRDIQKQKGEESSLEKQIKDELNYNAFVKIKGNNISVIVRSDQHDVSVANKIMNLIQKNYETQKYISVKFE
ncbi:MAG: SpoIIIAH-like family protein [Bacilli bacterium]|nr:SpoIIIAH-like family protein [Bacilli bacterium]